MPGFDAVNVSFRGVTMFHITGAGLTRRESAYDAVDGSSAGIVNFRCWHIADVPPHAVLGLLAGVKQTPASNTITIRDALTDSSLL